MSGPALPPLRTLEVGGRELSWREAGEGIPLVLVHGIGGHSGSWAHQFEAFAASHRVIAWDAPGYGGSDIITAPQPSPDDYARPLAQLLAVIGADAPHLVGHSLGSIMIAAAEARHGVKPRSLTFLQPVTGTGTLAEGEREKIRQARILDMQRLGAREFAIQRGATILSKTTPPARASEAIAIMEAVPERGYLAAWDMMCRADLFGLLDARHPTMVICGSDDPVCPPASAQAIADRIAGASFHRLDNVGHYASVEAPERLNALLRDFIAANERGG